VPLEPSKPSRFAYVAAQKERRRKHRTEATVGTEDALPWVFYVFFGGQTRESPVLKAGLATSRFSRSDAAEQGTVQFIRAHRDLRASLSPSVFCAEGETAVQIDAPTSCWP